MPGNLLRFGVRLHGGQTPRECIDLAVAAEDAGFASVWLAENPLHRGVMPTIGACAAQTRRIAIGTGVVNPYQRHPTLIAAEFAALDELAGGRIRLGIGAGIGARIHQFGLPYRPVAALGDAVHIVRKLLRGESVTYRGPIFSAADVALAFRPLRPDMPIYLAAMGDKSLALCGRLADGLVVSNMCPAAYVERAVSIVQQTAATAGRPRLDIVQYVPCVVRPKREPARRLAKIAVGGMLAAFWPASGEWPAIRDTIVRLSGIPKADVVLALERLRRGEPADRMLDERFVDAFAIAGTADECRAQAAHYRAAGVDELVLTFAGDQPRTDMAYLSGALRNEAAWG